MFYREIVISQAKGKLSRKAQKMFEILANEAIKKKQYKRPEDRKDCLQSGLEDMFTNWQSFNPQLENAFSYFTELFKRGSNKGFNTLYRAKGLKKGENVTNYSIDTSNDGNGMFNLY